MGLYVVEGIYSLKSSATSLSKAFPDIEERVLTLWDKDESFKKSLDSRPETEPYTFYDGPPLCSKLQACSARK